MCILNIKWDILVQKIKVRKYIFIFNCHKYEHGLHMLSMRRWTTFQAFEWYVEFENQIHSYWNISLFVSEGLRLLSNLKETNAILSGNERRLLCCCRIAVNPSQHSLLSPPPPPQPGPVSTGRSSSQALCAGLSPIGVSYHSPTVGF